MDRTLVALKLFLDELGVPVDISTVTKRKGVQKAVYLGQLSGLDLGYRHGWYVMGPYSPPLTRDYYKLAEELAQAPNAYDSMQLRPTPAKLLAKVKPIFEVPANLKGKLDREGWLELLASYHYLRTVSGLDHENATKTMIEQKEHLAEYVPKALEALQKLQLVTA